MSSKEVGFGFPSRNSLAFKRYLNEHAPVAIREIIAPLGFNSGDALYFGIIKALKKLKNKKNGLDTSDVLFLKGYSILLSDRAALKRCVPDIYNRLMIAGIDFSVDALVNVVEESGNVEMFRYLIEMFPGSNHGSRFWHQNLAILTQTRVSAKIRARHSVQHKHKKTDETKRVVIEQWEEYRGDKSTAASFANKLCGGSDAGARPDFFYDINNNKRLDVPTVTNRTVRKWINEHLSK